MTYDVVVVGAGVIGCSIAYQLARENVKVAVVDKGEVGREASWASAGILSHGNPSSKNSYARLATSSRAMFADLAAELREATGIDPEYRDSGGLHLIFDQEEASAARDYVDQSVSFGIPAEFIAGGDIQGLEPALSEQALCAIRFAEDGSIRNPRYVRALAAAAMRSGARYLAHEQVTGFDRRGAKILSIHISSGQMDAENFVLACGAWTNQLGPVLDRNLPVFPSKGQIVLLESQQPRIEHVIHAGDHYLVPRSDGKVIVGATVESAGYDKRPTAAGIGLLLDWALQVAPGLKNATFVDCWAGLRPAPKGGNPFLGRVPGFENLYIASGHNRNGILLSAATGKLIKELILSGDTSLPLDDFALPA